MKKRTVGAVIVFMVLIAAVVGYYAFLSGKHREEQANASLSSAQIVLSRDMDYFYTYYNTPKEVITYYTEIQKCFYNEECTSEEIQQLGMRARELYDAELLEVNETEAYLQRLEAEIVDFQANKQRITGISVASSTAVEYFSEDGYDFARISCGYTLSSGKEEGSGGLYGSVVMQTVYLLRRDENKHWKIYGWQQNSASKDDINY